MTTKTTFEGRDIAAAVEKAAKALGVDPGTLQYDVLAGQGGGFALIRLKAAAAPAATYTEKLTGSPGAGGGASREPREAREPREPREPRGEGEAPARDEGGRDRDRGPRRDRDRGPRREGGGDRGPRREGGGRDRDRGPRRDRDRGPRHEGHDDDRGPRRGRRDELPPVPTEGPTEVVMRVAEGTTLSEIGEDAHEVVREILTDMAFGMEVTVREEERSIWFDLESGVWHETLVANDRELLDAIEYLVDKIVNFESEDRRRIILDSGGIKRQSDEDLGHTALDLARRAVEEARIFKMGPLDPRSRRIVHVALRDVEGVETRSEGEGVFRRVCIIPKG